MASVNRSKSRSSADLPAVSPFLWRGFTRYVRRYLRRHFNAVRVARGASLDLCAGEAAICFGNHPGWWDPLIAILLHQTYFSERIAYAPIDQTALKQYPIFRKLGFYGIDLDSLEGAKRFLFVTRELLKRPTTAIWMTPGGSFADVRARTAFQPGLAHLAAHVSGVKLIPVAVEYTFWEERTPESLIEFGEGIYTESQRCSKKEWQSELELRLAVTQASLAEKVISRDASRFEVVLDGSAGVGGSYDFFRRLKSMLLGSSFDPRHGRQRAGGSVDG